MSSSTRDDYFSLLDSYVDLLSVLNSNDDYLMNIRRDVNARFRRIVGDMRWQYLMNQNDRFVPGRNTQTAFSRGTSQPRGGSARRGRGGRGGPTNTGQRNPLIGTTLFNRDLLSPMDASGAMNASENLAPPPVPPQVPPQVPLNDFQWFSNLPTTDVSGGMPRTQNISLPGGMNLMFGIGQPAPPPPMRNFFDRVNVYPSPEQIENATTTSQFSSFDSPVNTRCPITMENFTPEQVVTRINNCGHIFNQVHLGSWFRANVWCPLCRHDIRDISGNTTVEPPAIPMNTASSMPTPFSFSSSGLTPPSEDQEPETDDTVPEQDSSGASRSTQTPGMRTFTTNMGPFQASFTSNTDDPSNNLVSAVLDTIANSVTPPNNQPYNVFMDGINTALDAGMGPRRDGNFTFEMSMPVTGATAASTGLQQMMEEGLRHSIQTGLMNMNSQTNPLNQFISAFGQGPTMPYRQSGPPPPSPPPPPQESPAPTVQEDNDDEQDENMSQD